MCGVIPALSFIAYHVQFTHPLLMTRQMVSLQHPRYNIPTCRHNPTQGQIWHTRWNRRKIQPQHKSMRPFPFPSVWMILAPATVGMITIAPHSLPQLQTRTKLNPKMRGTKTSRSKDTPPMMAEIGGGGMRVKWMPMHRCGIFNWTSEPYHRPYTYHKDYLLLKYVPIYHIVVHAWQFFVLHAMALWVLAFSHKNETPGIWDSAGRKAPWALPIS